LLKGLTVLRSEKEKVSVVIEGYLDMV